MRKITKKGSKRLDEMQKKIHEIMSQENIKDLPAELSAFFAVIFLTRIIVKMAPSSDEAKELINYALEEAMKASDYD